MKKHIAMTALLLVLLLFSFGTPQAKERTNDENSLSAWEENRQEYKEKRKEHFSKHEKKRQEYKKRIGNNKYRQKARAYYNRQENVYNDDASKNNTENK